MRTTCAFRAGAVSIRQALPSRSTDAGVTPPWHWCARTPVWCLCRWRPRLWAASRGADDGHLCASAVPVGRTNSHGHGLDGDHPPRPAPGLMEALIRRKDETPDGTANRPNASVAVEQVTRIEPAQPAWKAWDSKRHVGWAAPTQADAVS